MGARGWVALVGQPLHHPQGSSWETDALSVHVQIGAGGRVACIPTATRIRVFRSGRYKGCLGPTLGSTRNDA